MATPTTQSASLAPLKNSKDLMTKRCRQCDQPFLVKYWDNELEWYIELNTTNLCRPCQNKK